jgi:hypothetical protein
LSHSLTLSWSDPETLIGKKKLSLLPSTLAKWFFTVKPEQEFRGSLVRKAWILEMGLEKVV